MALLALPLCASAQSSELLPDAPRPQVEIALAEPVDFDQQTAQPPADQSSSSSQNSVQQPPEKSQHEKAEEQIKEQEKQRSAGILPAFNVSYRADAVSMTGGQKMRLAFRSVTDPVTFGVAFVVAGYHEAAG